MELRTLLAHKTKPTWLDMMLAELARSGALEMHGDMLHDA
jgi:hypothetical protein